MFTLRENKKTKTWQSKEVCMGDSSYCNGPGVSGNYATMILSFGEDESGIIHIMNLLFHKINFSNSYSWVSYDVIYFS